MRKNLTNCTYVIISWTAIVRGAVLYGLSLGAVPMAHIPLVENRIARFSYGVSAAEHYIPGVHPMHKMYTDPFNGELMCRDRMQWFVQIVHLPFL